MPTDPWDRRTRIDDWRGGSPSDLQARGLTAELVDADYDPALDPTPDDVPAPADE